MCDYIDDDDSVEIISGRRLRSRGDVIELSSDGGESWTALPPQPASEVSFPDETPMPEPLGLIHRLLLAWHVLNGRLDAVALGAGTTHQEDGNG